MINEDLMILADGVSAAPAATETATAAAVTSETVPSTQVPEGGDVQNARPAGGAGGLMSFLPMILIFAVMIYLMYRGQKKEQKRRQEMLTAIKKGDKVVTIGGIHAEVVEIRDDSFVLKTAPNVEMVFSKAAVASTPAAPEGLNKK